MEQAQIERLSKMTPLAIVKEIHQRADTASEKVVRDAIALLRGENEEMKDLERLTELSELGFSKSKEVVENKEQLDNLRIKKKQLELIQDYAVRYPTYKYISTEDMQAICKDYNLILGSHDDYIETIPVKNQEEIIAFTKQFKKHPQDVIHYEGNVDHEGFLRFSRISKEAWERETNSGQNLVQHGNRTHYMRNSDYFTIAAPPDMFDLEGKIVENFEIIKKIEITDPIVLRTVEYGYLIVSVWGEELAIKAMQELRGMVRN